MDNSWIGGRKPRPTCAALSRGADCLIVISEA